MNKELSEIKNITDILLQRTGIDFNAYKYNTLSRRITKRFTFLGYTSIESYKEFIEQDENECENLKNDLLIGVTDFFRDADVFEYLNKNILPALFKQNHELRVWIAGCSTGEEAYSIAILLDKFVKSHGNNLSFKVFATDVSAIAVAIAGKGIYTKDLLQNLSENEIAEYFTENANKYQVKKTLREKIVFAVHNLLADPPFIKMDLISCRNLLIYLKSENQQKVFSNFIFALNPNAYLQLGNSESLGSLAKHFKVIDLKLKVFQLTTKMRLGGTISDQPFKAKPAPKFEIPETITSPKTMNDFSTIQNILEELLPSMAVLDSNYNIIYINGDIAKYLKVEQGIFHPNFLKMIDKKASIILKNGIAKARESQKSQIIHQLKINSSTEIRSVDVRIQTLRDRNEKEHLAIIFENDIDVAEPAQEFKTSEIDEFSQQKIKELESQLEKTSIENSDLEQQLDELKEKMQASNEELLASNEELQATNEEMQSINEELTSLNADYQEKNLLLTSLNDEINNLLISTEVAALFLDKDLNIRNFTPAFKQHITLQQKDIGRAFNNFATKFSNAVLKEINDDCKLILEQVQTVEREITNIDNETFLRRITPFTTKENKVDGVVITLVDITNIKNYTAQIIRSEDRYKKLIDNMPVAFAYHRMIRNTDNKAIDSEFLDVNPQFEKLTGIKKNMIVGKSASAIFSKWDSNWIKRYEELIDTEIPLSSIEFDSVNKRYFEIHGYAIEKQTFVTLISDVTEKINHEKILEASEEKYRSLVDNALVGVYQTTEKGEIVFGNDAMVKLYGYKSFEDLSKVNAFDLYKNQKDRKHILDKIKANKSISNHECTYIKKDGSEITLLVSARKIGNNVSGMLIDITNRKKFYDELQLSEKRFKDLISSSIDGFIRTNRKNIILEVNPAFCNITGYKQTELIGMNIEKITTPESVEQEVDIDLQVKNKGYSKLYRKNYIHKDGHEVPVELRKYSTYGPLNGQTEFWAFIHDIADRLQKEKQIEENKQRLELALNSAKQGLYDLNLITGDAIVNTQYVTMLGYEPNSFKETNKNWLDRLHPEDHKHTEKAFNDYLQGKSSDYRTEFRQKTANGNYKWILSVGKITEFDEDGKPLRMLGTHTDIDTLKRTEEKLSASRERFRLATAASNIGIWDWKVTENEVYYSSTWKSQVGYAPDELENQFKTWEDLLHPDDYDRMHNDLNNYLSHPDKFFEAEFRLRHKNGSYIWIFNRASSVLDEKGNVIRMFGAHTDITAQKIAREKLQVVTKRLELATQSAKLGIWEFDVEEDKLIWNDEMFIIYGKKPENFKGTFDDWSSSLHPDERETEIDKFSNRISKGKEYDAKFHIIRPNNEMRCIHAQAIAIKDFNNKIVKYIGVNLDITNEEQIKEELIKAKERAEVANIHKNNFLANMSHEIRTPMNGIIGFAELLKEDSVSAKKKELYLHIINSNSQSLLSLIDDIIDISKIEANEISVHKEPVDINELLLELETEYNQTKKHKQKTEVEFVCVQNKALEDKLVRTDRMRIRQVFVNLLNNALKFTDTGKITFGCVPNNKNLEFFVNDDGIGVPKEKTEEIFERFYRLNTREHRKYSGTGLGLAISRGLIQLLGGTIWHDTSYKKGASFKFTIPNKTITKSKLLNSRADIFTDHDKSLVGTTALLVEDQENIYTFFREVLKDTGMNLVWVDNGEDAIKTYKKMQSEINVILMDINLPGISGIEASQTIIKEDPAALIIAQTAYAMPEEIDKFLKAGCCDYVTKPIKPEELIMKLKKYC